MMLPAGCLDSRNATRGVCQLLVCFSRGHGVSCVGWTRSWMVVDSRLIVASSTYFPTKARADDLRDYVYAILYQVRLLFDEGDVRRTRPTRVRNRRAT